MATRLKDLPPEMRRQAEEQIGGEPAELREPAARDFLDGHIRRPLGRAVLTVVPMGKPRMTQQDKWKKRPPVIRYHAFRDEVRRQMRMIEIGDPSDVSWKAYLPIPKSWSKKKKEEMKGRPHRQRPDRDNIDKAILDSLFEEDCRVSGGRLDKYWDDGNGPRIVLEWRG